MGHRLALRISAMTQRSGANFARMKHLAPVEPVFPADSSPTLEQANMDA